MSLTMVGIVVEPKYQTSLPDTYKKLTKRTKKVQLGIYRSQIRPNDNEILIISGQ